MSPPSALHALRTTVQASSKKKKDEDDDPDYREKQLRFNFKKGSQKRLIKSTGHKVKHFDKTRFKKVWTCPACGRMLAYEDLNGTFTLTEYGYLSKSGKEHSLVAFTHDHHPKPWAPLLSALEKKGATQEDKRTAYQDESNLRAICKTCNESHAYEGVDLNDYDSSDDEFDPPTTPQHETQYNEGQFSGYRPDNFFV